MLIKYKMRVLNLSALCAITALCLFSFTKAHAQYTFTISETEPVSVSYNGLYISGSNSIDVTINSASSNNTSLNWEAIRDIIAAIKNVVGEERAARINTIRFTIPQNMVIHPPTSGIGVEYIDFVTTLADGDIFLSDVNGFTNLVLSGLSLSALGDIRLGISDPQGPTGPTGPIGLPGPTKATADGHAAFDINDPSVKVYETEYGTIYISDATQGQSVNALSIDLTSNIEQLGLFKLRLESANVYINETDIDADLIEIHATESVIISDSRLTGDQIEMFSASTDFILRDPVDFDQLLEFEDLISIHATEGILFHLDAEQGPTGPIGPIGEPGPTKLTSSHPFGMSSDEIRLMSGGDITIDTSTQMPFVFEPGSLFDARAGGSILFEGGVLSTNTASINIQAGGDLHLLPSFEAIVDASILIEADAETELWEPNTDTFWENTPFSTQVTVTSDGLGGIVSPNYDDPIEISTENGDLTLLTAPKYLDQTEVGHRINDINIGNMASIHVVSQQGDVTVGRWDDGRSTGAFASLLSEASLWPNASDLMIEAGGLFRAEATGTILLNNTITTNNSPIDGGIIIKSDADADLIGDTFLGSIRQTTLEDNGLGGIRLYGDVINIGTASLNLATVELITVGGGPIIIKATETVNFHGGSSDDALVDVISSSDVLVTASNEIGIYTGIGGMQNSTVGAGVRILTTGTDSEIRMMAGGTIWMNMFLGGDAHIALEALSNGSSIEVLANTLRMNCNGPEVTTSSECRIVADGDVNLRASDVIEFHSVTTSPRALIEIGSNGNGEEGLVRLAAQNTMRLNLTATNIPFQTWLNGRPGSSFNSGLELLAGGDIFIPNSVRPFSGSHSVLLDADASFELWTANTEPLLAGTPLENSIHVTSDGSGAVIPLSSGVTLLDLQTEGGDIHIFSAQKYAYGNFDTSLLIGGVASSFTVGVSSTAGDIRIGRSGHTFSSVQPLLDISAGGDLYLVAHARVSFQPGIELSAGGDVVIVNDDQNPSPPAFTPFQLGFYPSNVNVGGSYQLFTGNVDPFIYLTTVNGNPIYQGLAPFNTPTHRWGSYFSEPITDNGSHYTIHYKDVPDQALNFSVFQEVFEAYPFEVIDIYFSLFRDVSRDAWQFIGTLPTGLEIVSFGGDWQQMNGTYDEQTRVFSTVFPRDDPYQQDSGTTFSLKVRIIDQTPGVVYNICSDAIHYVPAGPDQYPTQKACGTLTTLGGITLAGTAFSDDNANGSRDANEPGIAGRTVVVQGGSPSVTLQVTTDPEGNFNSGNIKPGFYTVRELLPDGSTRTAPAGEGFYNVSLPNQGQSRDNLHFGSYTPATIAGTVFSDLDGSGSQEPGESGAAGLSVFMKNLGGTTVATATTDASGLYHFNDVNPGQFALYLDIPQGNSQSIPASNGFHYVEAIGGQSYDGLDFGIYEPAAIIGQILLDDAPKTVGIPNESTESDLSTLSLQVSRLGPATDPAKATPVDGQESNHIDIEVASDGSFAAMGLLPGDYALEVITPEYWTVTSDNPLLLSLLSGQTANEITVSVYYDAYAAPEVATASISGSVLHDVDGRTFASGPNLPPLAGVTLSLKGESARGNLVERSTQTATDGSFVFTGLPAGKYTVNMGGRARSFPLSGSRTVQLIEGQNIGLSLGATNSSVMNAISGLNSAVAHATLAIDTDLDGQADLLLDASGLADISLAGLKGAASRPMSIDRFGLNGNTPDGKPLVMASPGLIAANGTVTTTGSDTIWTFSTGVALAIGEQYMVSDTAVPFASTLTQWPSMNAHAYFSTHRSVPVNLRDPFGSIVAKILYAELTFTSGLDFTALNADFGDASVSYGTMRAMSDAAFTLTEAGLTFPSDGAFHLIPLTGMPALLLGSGVTADADGKPSDDADGDTDDGVILPTAIAPASPFKATVTVKGNGLLSVWVDQDRDGVFSSAERLISDKELSDGDHDITLHPGSSQLDGNLYVRFRLTTSFGIGSSGMAPDGEVEDYVVVVDASITGGGGGLPTGGDDDSSDRPLQFRLGQNFPNPFNPSTVIPFELAESSDVRIAVYDVTGRLVASLVDSRMSAGTHQTTFNATGLPSGVYVVRLEAGGQVLTSKLTLLK